MPQAAAAIAAATPIAAATETLQRMDVVYKNQHFV
jgi:hypothetical protein